MAAQGRVLNGAVFAAEMLTNENTFSRSELTNLVVGLKFVKDILIVQRETYDLDETIE